MNINSLEKAKKKGKSHYGTTMKLMNKVDDLLSRDDIEELRLRQFQADLTDKAELLKEILDLMIEHANEDFCDLR